MRCLRPSRPFYRAFNCFYSGGRLYSLFGGGKKPTSGPVLTQSDGYALFPEETHCLLGVNGSGKSKFLQELQQTSTVSSSGTRKTVHVSPISLDTHREFLKTDGDRILADVLGGVSSPDTRDILVRLGLFPIWKSRIRHLSTGEIRKALLARELLRNPKVDVLLLDQPFDGLDVKARGQLQHLLEQTSKGFTRLLVDTGGKNLANAYKTQLVLVVNRIEHATSSKFLTHAVFLPKSESEDDTYATDIVAYSPQKNMQLQIQDFFEQEQNARDTSRPAVEFVGLSIAYGDRTLLDDLHFSRSRKEHWALLGPNGSGKSSLMRVLTQMPGHGHIGGDMFINGMKADDTEIDGMVEMVSTDQHIKLLERSLSDTSLTASRLIEEKAASVEKAEIASDLFALDTNLLSRSFTSLSNGEQRLVMIARAIAACPEVLVLDEITHGLDPYNRQHVLQVINTIGTHASHAVHLILITHHDDEIVPCFQDVFEIQDTTLHKR